MRESDREFETETSKKYRIIFLFLDESMIVGTLVNSMLAYMSLFHFEEALKCADFILDHHIKDPEIYYRKA